MGKTGRAREEDREDRGDRSGAALPRGPQALPREQVAEHQRQRLYAAMVQCVQEHGYVATTISELVSRAGVSRRSFYEQFRNKDECLLATYDTIVARLGRRLRAGQSAARAWDEQLEAFIRTLFDAAGDRPDAARLVCVEMGAAGPAGVRRWADGAEQLRGLIVTGFARADGPGTVPDPVARAMVGALRRILYTRVRRARSSRALRTDLSKLVPDLLDWIACYYPSPAGLPLRPGTRLDARDAQPDTPEEDPGAQDSAPGPPSRAPDQDQDRPGRQEQDRPDQGRQDQGRQDQGRQDQGRQDQDQSRSGRQDMPARGLGGRAPGTLSARPLSGGRGLPRGEHNLPHGFVTHNQRERIFDAIANLTAKRGYPALSLDDIATEAAVSLQTFYAHFAGKEEAFIATYETGHARAMAVINQTLARQTSWIGAVRAGAAALLELLACEPSYAHLACVDVMIAYPHMAQRAHEANDFYADLLDLRTARDSPSLLPAPVIGEAIVGGVFELLHDYVLRGQSARLPELTDYVAYIALAPFLGAQAAWGALCEES